MRKRTFDNTYRPLTVYLLNLLILVNYAILPFMGKAPVLPELFWPAYMVILTALFGGRSYEKTRNGGNEVGNVRNSSI